MAAVLKEKAPAFARFSITVKAAELLAAVSAAALATERRVTIPILANVYGRVIPKDNDKHVMLETAAFGRSLNRVSAFMPERKRPVKLNVDPGKLTLSTNSCDCGKATERLSLMYSGKPVEVGFQVRYVLDLLRQMGDRCEIVLMDGFSPVIWRDPDKSDALFVLMPMRV